MNNVFLKHMKNEKDCYILKSNSSSIKVKRNKICMVYFIFTIINEIYYDFLIRYLLESNNN